MSLLSFTLAPPRRRVSSLAIGAIASLALLAPLARPAPVLASDPAGVYSRVEDVVVEPPKDNEPLRVRVYGVHALSYRIQEGERRHWGVYHDPEAGYLYFACPPGREAVCRMEWTDLEKAKGDTRCAAYGDRYLTDPKPNGRLRPYDESPTDPDTYPIGQGVLMTEHGSQGTCDAIAEFAAARDPQAKDSYLPRIAADAAGDADLGQADPPSDLGGSGGVADGPVSPALGLLLVVGLSALGLATAVVWTRQRRP